MVLTSSNSKNILDFLKKTVKCRIASIFKKETPQFVDLPVTSNLTCEKEVPTSLIDNPNAYAKKERDYQTRKEIIKGIAPSFYEENVSDEEIKKVLNIFSFSVSTIHYKDEEGKNRFFTSQTKGTKRYNSKYYWEIKKRILSLQSQDYETFGLTLTSNPDVWCNLPYVSWKHFKPDYDKLHRYLTEKLKAKVIRVMESTKRGYPHAHLFIAFPKGTIPNYEKMPVRKAITYGMLVDIIKTHIKHPIFNLQKVAGDKLQNYMSKYIGKMSEVNLFSLAKKEEPLTSAERKVALCYIYTTLLGIRQFDLPKKSKVEKKAENENQQVSGENFTERKEMSPERFAQQLANLPKNKRRRQQRLARLRAYLICLCNNSPCFSKNPLYFMSQKRYEQLFNVPIEEFQDQPESSHKKYVENAHCITCGTCFYWHFANFIKNKSDVWLDKALWFENGACAFAFTEEIKNDNELFLNRLLDYTDYITHCFNYADCKPSVFFNSFQKQKAMWGRVQFIQNCQSDEEHSAILKADDCEIIKRIEEQGGF